MNKLVFNTIFKPLIKKKKKKKKKKLRYNIKKKMYLSQIKKKMSTNNLMNKNVRKYLYFNIVMITRYTFSKQLYLFNKVNNFTSHYRFK